MSQSASPPPEDDQLVNPPWETETGRLAATQSVPAEDYAESEVWGWDTASASMT
jgi:hypothetical protein